MVDAKPTSQPDIKVADLTSFITRSKLLSKTMKISRGEAYYVMILEDLGLVLDAQERICTELSKQTDLDELARKIAKELVNLRKESDEVEVLNVSEASLRGTLDNKGIVIPGLLQRYRRVIVRCDEKQAKQLKSLKWIQHYQETRSAVFQFAKGTISIENGAELIFIEG
jgi:hypothetical protein